MKRQIRDMQTRRKQKLDLEAQAKLNAKGKSIQLGRQSDLTIKRRNTFPKSLNPKEQSSFALT